MVSKLLGEGACAANQKECRKKARLGKGSGSAGRLPTSVPTENNVLFLVSQSATFLVVNDTPNNV